jgi:hypothetical protein
MKKTLMVFPGLVCFTFLAPAAGVTGKCTAEFPARNGTQTNTFTFKTAGGKGEASVATQLGDTRIPAGKIVGEKLTFITAMNYNGNEFKISETGGIDFSVDRGRGDPQTFTAKKAQ